MRHEDLPYRRNVGIMLLNAQGQVWLGRRFDKPNDEGVGQWWQMPQGGIDTGELPQAAALRELWEEVGRLGLALQRLGVGEGDRVAVVLPMGIEATAAIYASARIGAIAVPIFSGFSASAIAARFEDSMSKS